MVRPVVKLQKAEAARYKPDGRRDRSKEQCCGSLTFWYGSGSADSYNWLKDLIQILFSPVAFNRYATKNNFIFLFFSLIYILKIHLRTSFFKDKKSQRNHKTVENKDFVLLIFLLDDGRIRICVNNEGSERFKNTEPQHW